MPQNKKVPIKVHSLPKKNYTDPKIYSGKDFDLSKPWYVYYYFRNPVTGLMDIKQNIKRGNYYKTKKERLDVLVEVQRDVLELLRSGFNPYAPKTETEIKFAPDALDYALSIKKNEVGNRTYEGYAYHIKHFKDWISANYPPIDIKNIDKKIINLFLNSIASASSNRSRNNYRGSLSAVFTVLVEYDYIEKNIVLEIKNLDTKTKRDPTWSEKDVLRTDKYLFENDKTLLLFVHFVDYMFWRPKENCRLLVKDINLDEKLITVQTKTQGAKTKLIPDILIDELTDYLRNADPEDLLFTPNGSGQWDRELDGRRSYFTLKFKRIKTLLKLPKDYTIYGRRHTGVTKVYKNLLKENTKDKALEILASITGHTSKAMLDYIHYVDASLPAEYSKYLK